MDKTFEIIGRHLRNESSDEDERYLKEWLAEDTANHVVLKEAATVWNDSAELRKNEDVDVDLAWNAFKERSAEMANLSTNKTAAKWKMKFAVAASFFIAILFIYLLINNREVEVDLVATTEVQQDMTLPDGTIIWLNKGASAKYKETVDARLMELNGEAFFEVKRDPSKPFVITTHDMKTEVIGTSFNIRNEDGGEVEVSVASGKVKVYNSRNKKVTLTKGQSSVYDTTQGFLKKRDSQDLNYLSWKTGVLKFDNSEMSYVIKKLNKHYGQNISISKVEDLHKPRLTAKFDNQNLEEVIEMISLTTDVELVVKRD